MKFPVGGKSDFHPCPSGSHAAVVTMVVYLGLQPGSQMYPSPRPKVYIRFEVPAERAVDDEGKDLGPAIVGEFYTASMNEKAKLREHLEGWAGKTMTDAQAEQYDVASILGKACMISVKHTEKEGKTYANIASISALPKGMPKPEPEGKLILWDDEHPQAWDDLPEFLQTKINARLDKAGNAPAQETESDPEDILPF
jgi:hypothetical protein